MFGRYPRLRLLALLCAPSILLCAAVSSADENQAKKAHAMPSHVQSAPTTTTATPGTTQSNATISFVCCSYSPTSVTIDAGESVTWNGDFDFHPLAQMEGPEDDTQTPGGFGSQTGTTYTYMFPTPGTYYFACLFHGTFGGTMRGEVIVNGTTGVPDAVDASALKLRVLPNPTYTTATASFALPRAMNADVSVYDLSGAHVITLQHGMLPAGNQRVAWNGTNSAGNKVGSGIYFIRVTGERFRVQAKVAKVR